MRGVESEYSLIYCLFFFFWGFNLLEAMLPSLVSRVAPAATKGSAMGLFNTFQFSGVFLGGVCGGLAYGQFDLTGVHLLCSVALLIWVYYAYSGEPLSLLDSLVVSYRSEMTPQDFMQVSGVEEAVIVADDKVAYLKIDKEKLDRQRLDKIVA